MHPKPTTTAAPSKRKGKPKPRPKRGRPRGTVKAPRQTVQARILTTTAVWLRRQHPTARTLHHAAAQALDLLAQMNDEMRDAKGETKP